MRDQRWGQETQGRKWMDEFSELRMRYLPIWPLAEDPNALPAWLQKRKSEVGRTKAYEEFKELLNKADKSRDTQGYPWFYADYVKGALNPASLKFDFKLPMSGIIAATKAGYYGTNISVVVGQGYLINELGYSVDVNTQWQRALMGEIDAGLYSKIPGTVDIKVERANLETRYYIRLDDGTPAGFAIGPDFALHLGRDETPDHVVLAIFEHHIKMLFHPLFLPKTAGGVRAFLSRGECRTPGAVRGMLENAGFTTIQKGLLKSSKRRITMKGLKVEDGMVTVKSHDFKPQSSVENNGVVLAHILGQDLK